MATLDYIANAYLSGAQTSPTAARLLDGRVAAVWNSDAIDGDGGGIALRLFSADGQPLYAETRVNTFTTGVQGDPSVAALLDGGFVVAWTSAGQDGSGNGIYAQRYSAAGLAVGAEFRVNTNVAGTQMSAEVAGLANGGFVIGFAGVDADGTGARAQVYDALGRSQGADILLNQAETGSQTLPQMVARPDGGFFAVYYSDIASTPGLYLRPFDATGAPTGPEVRVTGAGTWLYSGVSDVAVLTDGDFVILANVDGVPTAYHYTPAGTPVGGAIVVATPGPDYSVSSFSVAELTDGGYQVVWQSTGGATLGYLSQRFNANDAKVGGIEFALAEDNHLQYDNSGTTYFSTPAVVGLEGGGYMTLIHTYNASSYDIVAAVRGQGTAMTDYLSLDGAGRLQGLGGGDLLQGSDAGDTLSGGDGDDTLIGNDGDDLLFLGAGDSGVQRGLGGAGNDLIQDGTGRGWLDGGDGDDLLRGNAGDDTLIGGNGNDLLMASDGNDLVDAGAHHDRAWGGDGADTLLMGWGNDTAYGGRGNDTLEGSNGQDQLYGEGGDDVIAGDGDRDTLNGGAGDDTLTGGAGADRFVYATTGFGEDVITDFEDGLDKLRVFAAVATGMGGVTLTDLGAHAQVEMGGGSILILNAAGLIDAGDFIF